MLECFSVFGRGTGSLTPCDLLVAAQRLPASVALISLYTDTWVSDEFRKVISVGLLMSLPYRKRWSIFYDNIPLNFVQVPQKLYVNKLGEILQEEIYKISSSMFDF